MVQAIFLIINLVFLMYSYYFKVKLALIITLMFF